MNNYGQMVRCQIGPAEFDPLYEFHQQCVAEGNAKLVPYRANGASYTFARKRDFEAAVQQLRKNGYVS